MHLKILETNLLKYIELHPAHFLTARGLEWQACFKKTKVKLELLTDINNILLTIEKGIRGVITDAIHRYAEANNKYMKNYDKTKNHHIFNTYTQIIYMDGQCLKNRL